MSNRLLKPALLAATALQAMSPAWAYISGIGQPIWSRSDAVNTPATPATYAFGIWSFIFLSSGVYTVWALRTPTDDALLKRIGWWSASAFLLNAVWGVVQQVQGVSWATVVLIFGIVGTAFQAFRPVAEENKLSPTRSWLVALPLGVLSGWITTASPVNINQAIVFNGLNVPMSESVQAIATLLASGGLVVALMRPLRAHPAYVGASIWALVGVVAANVARKPNPLIAGVAGALALAVLGSSILIRRRSRRNAVA